MNAKLANLGATISKALPLCKPTTAEYKKISLAADKCKKLVEQEAARNADIVVDVVFGGSFAKGTWLRGDADVDVFVKMRTSVDLEGFEVMGKNIGLRALKNYQPELRYSDHPYVEAHVDGIRVNVVPCYDVEQGKWQSAADRSPFHTEYVIRNLDEQKKGHVRLLKKFLKSAGIYGAEISTGGFSGYVSEVLIIKYGSFEGVLDAFSDLRSRQVMAVNDQYDPDVVKGFSSPLVVIDPVDPRRNLGTAISPESVGKFVLAARSFISNPSMQFFSRSSRKASGAKANALYPNMLIVEFRHRRRSPDVIWGQLKRSLAAISKQLSIVDFEVLRASCITDEKSSAAMAFLLESVTLPRLTRRRGPEVFRKADSTSFLQNPKNSRHAHVTWVDADVRVSMLVDRKETSAVSYVKALFGSRLENSGISRDLLADKGSGGTRIRIYNGAQGNKMSELAREVVAEIVSTEHFILRRV